MQILSKDGRMLLRIWGLFDIHAFEKDGKIYKILGIEQFLRIYKRTPIIWSYKQDVYNIVHQKGGIREEKLMTFISLSLSVELLHYYIGLLCICYQLYKIDTDHGAWFHIFLIILNILWNIYPIFLQRYKRAKIPLYFKKYKDRYWK